MDTLMTGRGMQQNVAEANVAGRTSTTPGGIGGLNHQSMGVYGVPDVSLAFQFEGVKSVSVVKSNSGNLRLKKGMPMVLRPGGE
jgi:hypothetical protein